MNVVSDHSAAAMSVSELAVGHLGKQCNSAF